MIWNFVTECNQKTNLIVHLNLKHTLGHMCVLKEPVSCQALEHTSFHSVMTYLKHRVTSQLYAARAHRSEDNFWAIYTLIFTKRYPLEGEKTLEHCIKALGLWSGGSHRVYTMMGKLQNSLPVKFRLASTKVKFKLIPNNRIIPLAETLLQESTSGGYKSFGCIGQYIRHTAGPVGGCEGVPLLPLIHFLQGCQQEF